jgi:hypothetical protein
MVGKVTRERHTSASSISVGAGLESTLRTGSLPIMRRPILRKELDDENSESARSWSSFAMFISDGSWVFVWRAAKDYEMWGSVPDSEGRIAGQE